MILLDLNQVINLGFSKINKEWSGCWIGEKVSKLTEEKLYERIENADVIIFNIHGGGFRIGKSTMYMDTYIAWIQKLKELYNLKVMIMSVDYRLAPEYKYPAPVEDVVRAYEHLILGYEVNPQKIIATGDSAGAALILEMLFITHDPSMFEIVTDDIDDPNQQQQEGPLIQELPRPAGTVLVSPLVTDETTSLSWKENVKYDYISQQTAKVIKKDYFESVSQNNKKNNNKKKMINSNNNSNNSSMKDEVDTLYDEEENEKQVLGIAKLQTGFQAFLSPHVLMYIGNLEVLRDDALQIAEKAKMDGVKWTTVAEDLVHDWFCVREVVKDKSIFDRADKTFADFVYRVISEYRHQQSMIDITLRRASEGLHTVMEHEEDTITDDDDDDDDSEEFHEVLTLDDIGITMDGLRRSSKSSNSYHYI
ncbi:unnamed protein product [Cunninghamella echinulata]